MEKFFPEALYDSGFTDLISVTPPGAALVPSSKITPSQLGKVPGRRTSSGLWAGYDWRQHQTTKEHVRQWAIDGANVGLRADRFPAVDIDVTDASLARIIEQIVRSTVGDAPLRIGRAPKRLLMFRTDEPFSRMRLSIETKAGEHHLIEILGRGQQYLVYGTHPATGRPYEWDRDIVSLGAQGLPLITREQASKLLDEIAETIDQLSLGRVTREGDGRNVERAAGDQRGLVAPSIEVLREAVEAIPNTNTFFPDRADYIKLGHAIRAACGEDLDEGYNIFSAWAAKWEGNGRSAGNDPEVVLGDWRRMRAPFAVGWSYIAELARSFGFNVAALEFPADQEAAPVEEASQAPMYSEQWLADKVTNARRSELRFVPKLRRWIVWRDSHWVPDPQLLAEDIVKQELRKIGAWIERQGATDKERAANQKLAIAVCSADKASNIRKLMQSDKNVAISPEVLDHDPWLLNTPNGIIDLRTGSLGKPDPDQLCTRVTSVPADFSGAHPEWDRFLNEATGGDQELIGYLQRLAGYALTGSTKEQHFTFVWGPGGNGKSVLMNTLLGIMGDYAVVASMDTFTASAFDKHSTDLAMLQGARLVTASETQAGKRWDEARVKSLTGGEPVTARYMRQDNFTYRPQFKLIFSGNHKPAIRDLDEAMRRRTHLVPFTIKPKVVDRELSDKLRREWPAILAWMVRGCLAWQEQGLNPPRSVTQATEEYFSEEDAIGTWLAETCDVGDGYALTSELFESWQEWANARGEKVGAMRNLTAGLVARGFKKWRHPKTRHHGFEGLILRPAPEFTGSN
jgi:P4 family phage/plasmid primase-like protien